MGQQRTGKERKDISMFRQCRGRTRGTWNHRASAAEPGGAAEAGSREGGTQLTPELRRLRSDPVYPEAIHGQCGARASLPNLCVRCLHTEGLK